MFTSAQSTAPSAVAAASIHPTDPRNLGCQYFWPDAQTFRTINATATCLVRFALDVEEFQIETKQRLSDRGYDITARTENPVSDPAERRRILTALLAERFQLRFHKETRTIPTYRLTIAKGGHKLRAAECAFGVSTGPGATNGRGADMASLSRVLSSHLGRRVEDATDLHGCFDFSMKWTPLGVNPAADSPPELSTALQEQLGFKLEPSRGPVELVIIDHVEPPSAN